MRRTLVCLAAWGLAAGNAAAQDHHVDGNLLWRECRGWMNGDMSDPRVLAEAFHCVGMFYGVSEVMRLNCIAAPPGPLAHPELASAASQNWGQLASHYVDWMNSNQYEYGDKEAHVGLMAFLSQEYPCLR